MADSPTDPLYGGLFAGVAGGLNRFRHPMSPFWWRFPNWWGSDRHPRLGVRIPRRLGRGGDRRAHRFGSASGDRPGAAPGGAAAVRGHPDAGGCSGLRPDGRHRRRAGRAPGGGAALPRAPVRSHDGWSPGHAGVGRGHHLRRARRHGGLPRPAGLHRHHRRGVPRGDPDRGEPAVPGTDRRDRPVGGAARPLGHDPAALGGPGRGRTRCRSRTPGTSAEGDGCPAARSPRPSSGSTSRSHARPTASTPSSSWPLTCRTRVVLPGTMQGELAQGARVALGRLDGIPVVVAATTDRRSGEPLTVGGLRTVRRGIALAQQWGLPVVTVVDTLGAQLSVEGEQSGIAGEISRVMLDLVSARTPDRRAAPRRRDRGSGPGPARHRPDRGRLAHVGRHRSRPRGRRPSATAAPTIRRRSPGTSGSGRTPWPS